jgi:hypothetical protein
MMTLIFRDWLVYSGRGVRGYDQNHTRGLYYYTLRIDSSPIQKMDQQHSMVIWDVLCGSLLFIPLGFVFRFHECIILFVVS